MARILILICHICNITKPILFCLETRFVNLLHLMYAMRRWLVNLTTQSCTPVYLKTTLLSVHSDNVLVKIGVCIIYLLNSELHKVNDNVSNCRRQGSFDLFFHDIYFSFRLADHLLISFIMATHTKRENTKFWLYLITTLTLLLLYLPKI